MGRDKHGAGNGPPLLGNGKRKNDSGYGAGPPGPWKRYGSHRSPVLKRGNERGTVPFRAVGGQDILWGGWRSVLLPDVGAERKELEQAQTRLLHQALQVPCDLLILDEACAAWQLGAVDREMLRQAVLGRPEHCEVVLTGREPADWMKEAAHYSTEMVCHSHPFDRGAQARPGIEF